MLAGLLLAGCAGTITPPWQERVVIKQDRGGFIARFIKKYPRWDRENKVVAVDGYCASSCTMAIGMIGTQSCASRLAPSGAFTDHIRRGIHHRPQDRKPRFDPSDVRPNTDDVKAWVNAHGGMTTYKKMLLMKWPETRNYFRVCN